ncbi:MAG: OB-fold nucleic acid binding domain-containing protein, partial [Polaromonas sp.]|nr:OB-fold nucleic acid binding domain-containing protein [Polaromonas sp.]
MSNTITSPAPVPAHDENQLMAERREKLKVLRQHQADGKGVAFPNDVKPEHRAEALFAQYDDKTKEELEPLAVNASVAGRMMLKRVMGKASFATLQDASFGPSGGRIQVYINNEGVGEDIHNAFKHWDLGDIVAATGTLFKTKTGELSIHATSIRLITKSLRPLPDKF